MSNQLVTHILDSSMLEYTITIVLQSLGDRDNADKRKRAASALAFFENLLDAPKEPEKAQLNVLSTYRAALEYINLAKPILDAHPGALLDAPAASRTEPAKSDVATPAQHVFALPELINLIICHIDTSITKSRRDTLRAASLTSVALYHAAQPRLWRRPRDLDTVQRQVRFAFGAAISRSGAMGNGLGAHVKRLRIRVMTGGAWNGRLITKIAKICPSITDLTLHWGDTRDGTEIITSESIQWLPRTLPALPNIAQLNLAQYVYAEASGLIIPLDIPGDAHIPFTKLKNLQLTGFSWYFDTILRGLGSSLTSLSIGHCTYISADQISSVARKLPSLTSLSFWGALQLDLLRIFVRTAPRLQRFHMHTFDSRDQAYMASVYSIIAALPEIKDIYIYIPGAPAGPAQLTLLAKSCTHLESLSFEIDPTEAEKDVRAALSDVGTANRATLESISELSGFKFPADDKLVDAFAAVSNLQRIDLTFDAEGSKVSDSVVETLLTQCPLLELTDGLSSLVAGNALYEGTYRTVLEKNDAAAEEEWAEDVLAN